MNKAFGNIGRTVGCLLLIAALSCNNRPASKAVKKTAKGVTEIEFDTTRHNFGNLVAGEIVVYNFDFTNTGASDFIINRAESDCGCVRVTYSKQTVKPGERGTIEVEFNTAGLFGREYKNIEINGNCPESKHLVIFAKVKNEMFDFNR